MTKVHEFEGFIHSMELLRDENWDATAYPFSLPVLRGWDRLEFHPRVTFFVGENGAGKSTLIEALAVASGSTPKAGAGTSTSPRAPRTRPCISSCASHVHHAADVTATFCALRAILTSLRKLSGSTKSPALLGLSILTAAFLCTR
jgi:predicted ATPase